MEITKQPTDAAYERERRNKNHKESRLATKNCNSRYKIEIYCPSRAAVRRFCESKSSRRDHCRKGKKR